MEAETAAAAAGSGAEGGPIDGLRFARVSLVRRSRVWVSLPVASPTDGLLRRETPSPRPAALRP